MERNGAALRFDVEGAVLSTSQADSMCVACGEEFKQPLLAKVFSDFLVEEYYACPKCLSRVTSVERQKDFKIDEAEEEESVVTEVEAAVGEAVGCAHHLGYLKQRPKNTPIPEECLTCSKIIECMY